MHCASRSGGQTHVPPAARPFTASRFPGVPEDSADGHLAPVSGKVLATQPAPWESAAVRRLASRVGKDERSEPMLVEGPLGTVLAAVGERRDHEVAGRAVSAAMQADLPHKLLKAAEHKAALSQKAERMERGSMTELAPPRKPRPANLSGGWRQAAPLTERRTLPSLTERRAPGSHALEARPAARRAVPQGTALAPGASSCLMSDPGPAGPVAFGAVYEYRDRVGRPVFVGGTAAQPESSWLSEYSANPAVRELAQQGGSASVVWAGVGRGPCGHAEMEAARAAVATDRAARQRALELQSAKPYSRHSALM